MTDQVVLVTGAAGFLGHRVAAALGAHTKIVVLDRAGLTHPGAPSDVATLTLAEGDVRDRGALGALMKRYAVTDVVHCAAIAGVSAVAGDLFTATAVNIMGSVAVLDAALDAGVRRVVDASSEEVYGAPGLEVIGEDCALAPETAYGLHKATVERLAVHWTSRGLDYVAARMSWVYGPGFPRGRLPAPWLRDAAADRPSHLDAGGDHRADLVYVDDAARALVALLRAPRLNYRAYNVGCGHPTTLRTVAQTLHQVHPTWAYTLGPGALRGANERPALDVARIRADTGWVASTDLSAGLAASLPQP